MVWYGIVQKQKLIREFNINHFCFLVLLHPPPPPPPAPPSLRNAAFPFNCFSDAWHGRVKFFLTCRAPELGKLSAEPSIGAWRPRVGLAGALLPRGFAAEAAESTCIIGALKMRLVL